MTIDFPKSIVKRLLRIFDLELQRRSESPEVTLLGLKNLPIRTILDVGANLGQFAQMIAPFFPEARIYSFEPLPKMFAELKAHAGAQIIPIQVALGQTRGVVEMREHVNHPSSSSFLPASELSHQYYPESRLEKTILVSCMTLDAAINEFDIHLRKEILIKLDVQGFEDRVIAGGERIFGEARACILEICLDTLYRDQATFPQLLETLSAMGFSYAGNLDQSCADDGHVIFINAVFIRR